jgi:hypothetical protein
MSPFQDYTKEQALSAIEQLDAAALSTQLYYEGDHWQKGTVWVGPPEPDVANRTLILEQKIFPIFVSKNIIKEVIDAHRDAVIGVEPDWSGTSRETIPDDQDLPDELLRLIDEAEMMATTWWDKKQVHTVLQEATTNLLTTGRGPLRLHIPKAFISEDGTPAPGTIETWMKRICLTAPKVNQQAIIVDDDTQEEAGVYSVQRDDDTLVELSFLVSDDEKTILRIYGKQEGQEADTAPQPLGGHLLHFQMERKPLISEQIRQNQALFNTTLTMRTRNIGVAGFPERNFLNAKAPSHLERDPADPGKMIEVADPFMVGPGVTNFVSGHDIEDNEGNFKGVTTASVSYRDPVKVDTFEATENKAYQNILEEVRQLHRLIARDATASGESRIQARFDFVTSLRDTKPQIDAAGRWLLETALNLAAALSGQPNHFDKLRFRFDAKLNSGPLTSDERRLLREEAQGEKPVRSIQSAMKELGIDDPAAMLEEIRSEDLKPTTADLQLHSDLEFRGQISKKTLLTNLEAAGELPPDLDIEVELEELTKVSADA